MSLSPVEGVVVCEVSTGGEDSVVVGTCSVVVGAGSDASADDTIVVSGGGAITEVLLSSGIVRLVWVS
jgi:hypothetical protein